ncbi:L-carnitine dehydratase/bile acid-inducible protein F [Hyaloraphidium curvatum]|nr:L-carnitine dehydratase/bile acid-inducible protein F [Hyaloraphidium curvatum]KAI9026037.1 L-carnitine dehydratase/bile acid-inducible protein F [Hyaloraphidium curvatum]
MLQAARRVGILLHGTRFALRNVPVFAGAAVDCRSERRPDGPAVPVRGYSTASGRGFGTLDGLKVVDLTAVLMGPFCTQMLADHGADVVKVEGPEGDTTRQLPLFKGPGLGSMFLNLNRGKRFVGLDLKNPAGRDAVLRLCREADVFVHSMRADAVARLGLTYADVAAVRPDIVYANVYGFSRRGPYAKMPAYDDVIQAMSGMAGLQQRMLGFPTYSATLVADQVSGITALYAILMALFRRERTGRGQEIEVPMFETIANFVLTGHMNGSLYVPAEGEPVYPRAASRNRRPYKTKDGWVAALVYTDKQWTNFFATAGRPAWADEPYMASLKQRAARIDDVYANLASEVEKRTTAEWLDIFGRAEIPAARVNSTQDVLEDPHLNETGFFIEQDTELGRMRFPGLPAWFSDTPGRIDGPAKALGADTAQVLSDYGFSDAEIAGLREKGAMVEPK